MKQTTAEMLVSNESKYSIQRRELVKHLALKIIKKKQISKGLKLSYKLLGFATFFASGFVLYEATL